LDQTWTASKHQGQVDRLRGIIQSDLVGAILEYVNQPRRCVQHGHIVGKVEVVASLALPVEEHN